MYVLRAAHLLSHSVFVSTWWGRYDRKNVLSLPNPISYSSIWAHRIWYLPSPQSWPGHAGNSLLSIDTSRVDSYFQVGLVKSYYFYQIFQSLFSVASLDHWIIKEECPRQSFVHATGFPWASAVIRHWCEKVEVFVTQHCLASLNKLGTSLTCPSSFQFVWYQSLPS